MAYSHASPDYFSSSDYSSDGPPLFDAPVFYFGESSTWDNTAAFNDLGEETLTNTDYTSSFDDALSPQSFQLDVDSSPFSAGTPPSHALSEAADGQDWEYWESIHGLAPLQASAGACPKVEGTHTLPAGPYSAPPGAENVASPPRSNVASPNHPARVPIRRATAPHHNATSPESDHPAAIRHQCHLGRCKKSFSRSSDLNRHHLDVHSQSVKHHECAVETCFYSSRRLDKVKEHCQKMHHQPRGHERVTTVSHQA